MSESQERPRDVRADHDRKVRRGLPPLQLFAFVVVAMLAVFAFTRKIAAQGTGRGSVIGTAVGKADPLRQLAPPLAAPAPSAPPLASAKAALAPSASGSSAPAAVASAAPSAEFAAEGEHESPAELADQLKTAVAGPNGGVPIHVTGTYKSPFANPGHEQVSAKVGIMVETLEDYDIKKGSFTSHFYLSLTSEKPMPKVDLKATNGKLEEKELLADLPTFKLWKMVGTFHCKPDLHAYPFDTQELVIELEDDVNGQDTLRLRTDVEHSFLDSDFSVAGWDVAFIRARILSHYYPDRFENDDLYYSKFKFTLGIKRFATSAIFTVFMPALVIVLISLSGLWFPREQLEVRSNATTPMLAAAVLFHFALMQELPATAYLSRADKLMMALYICLAMHMLTSWLWFCVDEKHTDLLFRLGKYVCAPLTLVIMAAGVLL